MLSKVKMLRLPSKMEEEKGSGHVVIDILGKDRRPRELTSMEDTTSKPS